MNDIWCRSDLTSFTFRIAVDTGVWFIIGRRTDLYNKSMIIGATLAPVMFKDRNLNNDSVAYWLQDGEWWTSGRGWVGWAWLSSCWSVPLQHTTCLRSQPSVWSTCREVFRPPRLRPPHGLTCHHFPCGCGCLSFCYHTYNFFFSCSPAQEQTHEQLATVYFLSVSSCSGTAANRPITGWRLW